MYGSDKPLPQTNNVKVATVRQFDGGWDVVDTDLNLSSKYAKRLRNMFRAPDGSIQLRYGTALFADFTNIGLLDLVFAKYYNRFIIVVDRTGLIGAANGAGTVYLIFDDEIASQQSVGLEQWLPTDFVSSSEFNGELVLCNGTNKPLLVKKNLSVGYLQDIPTSSNTYVPIARYVCTHDQYLVMAGDPAAPSLLHISNKGTSGTWLGDAAPNDGVQFDLGSFVPSGSSEITGIASFRDKLVVTFEECVIIMDLGNYIEDAHNPIVADVIPNYGAVNHHTLQALGDDILFMDIVGVPSLARALISGSITPDRKSQLIDPAIQEQLAGLTTGALREKVFGVINRRDNQVLYLVPDASLEQDITERVGFMFTYLKKLKVEAWSEIRGWNWTCAARSSEGRLFFGKGPRLFRYGDKQDPVYADQVGYQEPFSDETIFSDNTGWTPIADADNSWVSGLPIAFDWELPWSDLKKRGNVKTSYYLGLDTAGDAEFAVDMFIDNMLYDTSQTGEPFTDGEIFTDGTGFDSELAYSPALSMDFVAGGAGAYGASPYGHLYGDGRSTADERLYAWPCQFKLMKLRVHGATRRPLSIISMSLYHAIGGIRRG